MKAKDKAIELCGKFFKPSVFKYEEKQYLVDEERAKQCALICVDEKIETLLPYAGLLDIKKTIDELEEVKEEINKL